MKNIVYSLIFVFNMINVYSQTVGNGVVDIDGNTYSTVIIGQQEWMSENLKTTKYANGDLIGTTPYNSYNYYEEVNPSYQWSISGFPNYGRLYTWFAATDSRNICPAGWNLPSATDWENLIDFLGGYNSGDKIKETGNINWDLPNSNATNSSGFSALPAGWHHFYGFTQAVGFNAFFWSSTEYGEDDGWFLYLNADNSNININGISPIKKMGLSCRCIKASALSSDEHTLNTIKIYPNPNSGNNLFIVSDLAMSKKVKVFDLLGKQIINTTIETEVLDISSLLSGIYFVNITEGERTTILKLVIDKQ